MAFSRYAAIAERTARPLLCAGGGALAAALLSIGQLHGTWAPARLFGVWLGLVLLGFGAAALVLQARRTRIWVGPPASDDWIALNGATLQRDGSAWHVVTIPNNGGYSAYRALQAAAGPVEVVVDLEVAAGRVGVALLDGDANHLHERVTSGEGAVRLQLRVDDGAQVQTLLVRNMATRGRISRVRLAAVAHRPGTPLAVPPPRSARQPPLAMKLRRRVAETEHDADRAWHTETRHRPAHEVALVIIDAWADHEIAGWQARAERNMRDRLAPLAAALRHAGVRIVHSAHDVPVHPLLAPQPGDVVLEGMVPAGSLVTQLREMGVGMALYAGYKVNMCVLTRPAGLLAMLPTGMDCALVRDASISLEAPWSLADQTIHAAMVDFVELNICPTVATDDLIASAASISEPDCAVPRPAKQVSAGHR
jgi:hypothetical protein